MLCKSYELIMEKTKHDFADLQNFRNMVVKSAEKYGDKDFYIYKNGKEEVHYSYNKLKSDCEHFGTALNTLELGGCHIAVIGETAAKNTVTYIATVATGGVIVPIDKETSVEQIINFLNLSECSAVVYSSQFDGALSGAADKLPNIRFFVPMSGNDDVDSSLPNPPRVLSFDDMLALGSQAMENGDNSYYSCETDMEKMCAILFTSGTTGTSKGVMLSQKNICSAVYASAMTTPYDEMTKIVSVLPQHHTYEMTCCHLAAAYIGATVFINDSLKYVMRNFAAFKPNALVLVPLFIETVYKRIKEEIKKKGMEKKVAVGMKIANAALKVGIDLRGKLFSQITAALGGEVKSIISGGAPISPSILKDFYTYGITIYEGYGITECAPLVSCNPPGVKPRFGSVGLPVYSVTVKIDKNDDEETGEILVKGDNVMLGYYKNEEATKEVFTEDGWFRTGDIGYVDKDGYIFITGRKKNVIILSNGKNVFPEELEEHLSHCELIKEAIAIGRADESGEIAITALVYPDYDKLEGKTEEEIEIIIKDAVNNVNRTLPSFKHMTEVEVMKEEFIKSSSKKIKRFLYK